MKVEWRDVVGYEGSYLVNNIGQIRGPSGKILKGGKNTRGYIYVILSKNNKQVNRVIHRLIANAFLENPENKCDVNHLNGIKTDNRLINLEWATRSENIQHAYDTGLAQGKPTLKGRFGNSHPNYRGPVIGTNIASGRQVIMRGVAELRAHGFDQGNVANCLRGKAKTHKAHTFRRVTEAEAVLVVQS